MKCQYCHTENVLSAKFCKNCGSGVGENVSKKTFLVKRNFFFKSKKKNRIAFVLVVIVAIAIWFGNDYLAEKKNLDPTYLKALMSEVDSSTRILGSDSTLKQASDSDINANIDTLVVLSEKIKTAVDYFYRYAKRTSFDDEKMKAFIEKVDVFPSLFYSNSNNDSEICGNINTTLIGGVEYFTETRKVQPTIIQKEKMTTILNNYCQILATAKKIDIQREGESIPASYAEKESTNLPVGYSLIASKSQDGRKEKITLTVDAVNKGTNTIVTSEPKNGEKIVGKGEKSDISKKAEDILEKIIALWNDQTLSASTIEPFLDEKSKDQASDWQDTYSKVIFNWKRFDNFKVRSSDSEFDKDAYVSSGKTTAPILLIHPDVDFNDNIGSIPFFYDASSDSWGSSNETIRAIFDIAKNQNILASISPDTIKFKETDNCMPWYGSTNSEFTLTKAGIKNNNYLYLENGSYYTFTKLVVTSPDFDSNSNLKSSNASLDSDLIDFVNKQKKNNLTITSIEQNNGNCKSDKDVKLKFF